MRHLSLLFALAASGLAAACMSPADSLLSARAGGHGGGPGGTANDATTTIAGTAPLTAVPIRRLNRAEYNNTIRDLVGDLS